MIQVASSRQVSSGSWLNFKLRLMEWLTILPLAMGHLPAGLGDLLGLNQGGLNSSLTVNFEKQAEHIAHIIGETLARRIFDPFLRARRVLPR